MNKNPIINTIITVIFPYIIFYGLYIQIAGDNGPGGGFQAGAIFATARIALDMLDLFDTNIILIRKLVKISATGILIYLFIGIYGLIYNKEFLNYNFFFDNPQIGQQIGIFLVEIGVGLTVFSTLYIIYIGFKEK